MVPLQDITGFEPDAVVYHPEGRKPDAWVLDWAGIHGIPRLFAGLPIGMGEDLNVIAKKLDADDVDDDVLRSAIEAAAEAEPCGVVLHSAWKLGDDVFAFDGWG